MSSAPRPLVAFNEVGRSFGSVEALVLMGCSTGGELTPVTSTTTEEEVTAEDLQEVNDDRANALACMHLDKARSVRGSGRLEHLESAADQDAPLFADGSIERAIADPSSVNVGELVITCRTAGIEKVDS